MSRFAKFKEKIGQKFSGDKEPSADDLKKQEEATVKGERAMKGLLERIILRYYHRRLVGEVEITHTMLFMERTLACEIDGTDGECPVVNLEGADEGEEVGIDEADDDELDGVQSNEATGSEQDAAGTTDQDMNWAPPRVKAMVKRVGGLLNRMEQRAKCYKNQKYAESLTLSAGAGISDPAGLFSVSITCSASVPTLIASLEKKEELKASGK